ncbi:uncharacterized protein LOC112487147 [Cynoglossus semilaevis]|uniref:uncharacterized protein LOC112487147 n=1 Tax=Cynoglossus semilaevis TaxID=244447 RepID=UPI000D6244A8|nr:uncharacterized protein LOC112487147 [Cynoglossus semilaevis]
MAFSKERQTLVVTVLSLSGTFHRLEDVSVLGSLPPLFPCPIQASIHSSLSSEAHRLVLHLRVNSVNELQRCTFRAAVYTRQPHGLGSTTLGELDAGCGGKDWLAGRPFHFTKKLHPNKWTSRQTLVSQDVSVLRGGSSFQPQILVSLQYQSVEHRIKTSVLRADNLDKLLHTPAASDYQVVVNLHREGTVISSRETEQVSSAVWNSSFLFDLPPGDISQLPLTLQYIIVQRQIHSDSRALGRVLLGPTAADAAAAHWREMCSSQKEQSRWHRVPPELT